MRTGKAHTQCLSERIVESIQSRADGADQATHNHTSQEVTNHLRAEHVVAFACYGGENHTKVNRRHQHEKCQNQLYPTVVEGSHAGRARTEATRGHGRERMVYSVKPIHTRNLQQYRTYHGHCNVDPQQYMHYNVTAVLIIVFG